MFATSLGERFVCAIEQAPSSPTSSARWHVLTLLGRYVVIRSRLAALCIAFFTLLVGAAALAQVERQSIDMPNDIKAILKAQMRGHVSSLSKIVSAIGESDFNRAAEIAQAGMGVVRMDKAGKQGPGVGIGKHVPVGFKEIAKQFHKAAGDFARISKAMSQEPNREEYQRLMRALGKVTSSCGNCHGKYRIAD